MNLINPNDLLFLIKKQNDSFDNSIHICPSEYIF